jgi:hypothetical protein
MQCKKLEFCTKVGEKCRIFCAKLKIPFSDAEKLDNEEEPPSQDIVDDEKKTKAKDLSMNRNKREFDEWMKKQE